MEIIQKIKTIIYDALSSCQSCGLPEPCYHELIIDEITALPFDEFTRKKVFH